jgi:hypothetical protein
MPVISPPLTVTISNKTSIILSWPSGAMGFVLQQNSAFGSTNWTTYSGTISSNATTLSVTVPSSSGNSLFRLKHP